MDFLKGIKGRGKSRGEVKSIRSVTKNFGSVFFQSQMLNKLKLVEPTSTLGLHYPTSLHMSHANSSSSIAMEEPKSTNFQNQKSGDKLEQTDSSIPSRSGPIVSLPKEDEGPKNFWEKAYNALREQKPEIIDAYENDLLASEDLYQPGAFMRIISHPKLNRHRKRRNDDSK